MATAKEKDLQKQVNDLTAQVEKLCNFEGMTINDQDGNLIDWDLEKGVVCITVPELASSELVTIPNSDLRDQLRMAMVNAGELRKQHAHADAQGIDLAIDKALAVWGVE